MITIPSHLHSVVDHDGAVILDIPNDSLTSVNTIGAAIWCKLQAGKGADEIIADLARETGADSATVACDLDEFMEALKARKLLVAS